MAINKEYKKIIFGIKLRQLRQNQELSLQKLSNLSGVSVSYLNEIEKGKKYPNSEKLVALADALKVKATELKSEILDKKLAPVSRLLHSGILSELPLDLFGLEISGLLNLLSNAPSKLNAFIGTLLEVSRNYDVRVETFYFSVLRSYQEIHENYFPEIEEIAEQFSKELNFFMRKYIDESEFEKYLKENYNYKLISNDFSEHHSLLDIRSLRISDKRRKKLVLNSTLSSRQKTFYLAKEIGYNFMKMKERNDATPWIKIDNFDQVLNDFKASYFSSAVLINRKYFLEDLRDFFGSKQWNQNILINTMRQYNTTPEMVLQRMTNLLPEYFGFKELFFFKFNHKVGTDHYQLSKEMHLSRLNQPRGTTLQEHFCRRWGFITMLDELEEIQKTKHDEVIGRAQIARYLDTGEEFLLLSLAKPFSPTKGMNNSLSLGIKLNEKTRKSIRFLDDKSIKTQLVNDTCERCMAQNCKVRAAPPSVYNRLKKEEERKVVLKDFNPK
jgi:transcriptional regulator with XRE-family HTH domain